MKQWIPVASVIVFLLLMYNTVPVYVTWFLCFILIMLILNKWDQLGKYFA
jgi:hypothetical protein